MTTVEDGVIKPVEPMRELSVIRADVLNSMELEKPLFLVEKILPIGLCLIVSPPKYGKSWYGLDLCVSVATGSRFAGFRTNKAGCLYLALEDSNNRLQERMRKVLNGREAPPELGLSIHANTLQHGLIEQLSKYVDDNPETKLIVIDTFQKVRGEAKRSESAYSADYRDCGQIKAFADARKICVVLIHHMRKMRDISDTFANISGTAGITGAADTLMTMSRDKRDDTNTKLSIVGRDVEPQDYQIQFKKDICRWHMLGTDDEVEEMKAIEQYNSDPLVLTIKKIMSQNRDGWTGTAKEIIDASRMFGTPIHESDRKIGKSIEKYSEMLFEQDNIIYCAVPNGSGATKRRFYYGYNPFFGG